MNTATLTNYERETHIMYNQDEETATIDSLDPALTRKLKSLCKKYPDQFKKENDDRYGATFTVPKKCITVRQPIESKMTIEQRLSRSNYMKEYHIEKKKQKIS